MNKMEDWKLFNYLAGKSDPEEKEAVETWLAGDPSNKEKLEQFRGIWRYTDSLGDLESIDIIEDWNNVKSKIGFEQKTGYGDHVNLEDNVHPGDKRNLDDKIDPGELADMGDEGENIDNKKPGRRILPFNLNSYPLLKIAALIVIILIPAIILEMKYGFLGSSGSALVSEATEDIQRELILPDGSAITLNVQSEISYPGEFDKKQREVRLNGEAFFDVLASEEQPFLIFTGSDLVIEVIGTSFNVLSRKGEVVVQVVSGMVSLYEEGKERDRILIHKGEQGSYNSQGFSRPYEANPNSISWITQRLEFDNTLLGDVVYDLSRFSGKELIIRGAGMDEMVLTSTYENQQLEEILEEIKLLLNIEYTVSEDSIVLHPAPE